MTLLDTLLIGATGGQGTRQSSGQPSMMGLLSKASRSGHSAVVSGAMSMVSAYRVRNTNRKRAMKRAAIGAGLLGLGLWQLRSKSGSTSNSGGGKSRSAGRPSVV
ncbi:MAG: hypothetical protein ABEJ28_06290 [Salinigranum sp.]